MIEKNPMLFFMPHITNFLAQSLSIEDINGGFAFSSCFNGKCVMDVSHQTKNYTLRTT